MLLQRKVQAAVSALVYWLVASISMRQHSRTRARPSAPLRESTGLVTTRTLDRAGRPDHGAAFNARIAAATVPVSARNDHSVNLEFDNTDIAGSLLLAQSLGTVAVETKRSGWNRSHALGPCLSRIAAVMAIHPLGDA